MKLGLCTIAFRDRPLEEVISIADDYGFDGIEIWGQEPHMPATYDSEYIEKVRKLTEEKDLEISNGNVHVKGVQDLSISLGNIARILSPMAGGKLPSGFLPSLEATSYAGSTGSPIANGTNVAEVEVDILTGNVKLLKYSVAHDCGTMINPNIVEGQIIGGVVHGIGNALFERMIYSEAGQPLTNTYADYLLPLATEMPNIKIVHEESPSPLNGLGIKGAGEGGTIPATAAVIAAVENALEDHWPSTTSPSADGPRPGHVEL